MTGLEVFGVQVATKLTNLAISRILDGIIVRQDETLALLKDLSKDVQALLHGPYQTARQYLEEAAVPGRSAIDRDEMLKLAGQELMRALGQEHDPNIKADVHMTYALVQWAMRRPNDAQRHAAMANRLFVENLNSAIPEQNRKWRRKRLEYKLIPSGGAFSVNPKEQPQIKQAVSSLMTLCGRSNESARLSRALGGDIGETQLLRLEYVPEKMRYKIPLLSPATMVSLAPPQFNLYTLP